MKDLKVGLQMYSIKDEVYQSPLGALKKAKDAGYDHVELFAPYYRIDAKEIKKCLDKLGLKAVSCHIDTPTFFGKSEEYWIDFFKTTGIKYAVIPATQKGESINPVSEFYAETLKRFTKMADFFKTIGVPLSYHNHNWDFKLLKDNITHLDNLFSVVSASTLKTQIDIAWAHYAGYDPAEYIKKYADRSFTVHFRDYVLDSKVTGKFCGAPVGDGLVDIKKVINECLSSNIEYVFVEDETNINPLDSINVSRKYLKDNFGI